jgi:hypothetical protein
MDNVPVLVRDDWKHKAKLVEAGGQLTDLRRGMSTRFPTELL